MDKIGFIGLGIMGKPMAINLIKAGYDLTVFDLNKDSVDELRGKGAIAADSPKDVAKQVDIVISIVPDTPHVKTVALSDNGLVHGLKPGMLFIDMSTISATMEQEINTIFAKKNVETLDAPVSGGEVGAIDGTLSIMVGGDATAFERAKPIFEVLGGKVNHMGPIGAGQITKSCNQIATALATQGVIEALILAKKAGVDPKKVREAMLGGFAQSRALEIAGHKMIERDFTPGFMTKLYRKDLRISLQAGQELSVPLAGTSLVASEMDALIVNGQEDKDFSALITVIESLAGI